MLREKCVLDYLKGKIPGDYSEIENDKCYSFKAMNIPDSVTLEKIFQEIKNHYEFCGFSAEDKDTESDNSLSGRVILRGGEGSAGSTERIISVSYSPYLSMYIVNIKSADSSGKNIE